MDPNDRDVLHAWFVGYFPVVSPRYAMSVFIEDGTSGGISAAPYLLNLSQDTGFGLLSRS